MHCHEIVTWRVRKSHYLQQKSDADFFAYITLHKQSIKICIIHFSAKKTTLH